MIINAKTARQILFWLIYFLLCLSVISTYQKFYDIYTLDDDIFEEFVTSIQKMLLNNTLAFALLVIIRKEEFLNTEAALRYNRKTGNTIWLNSVLNSLIYTMGTYTIWFSVALLKNLAVDFSIFKYFPVILAYVLKLSATFVLLYILSGKYTYSFFFIIIWSLILLTGYLGLDYVGVNISFFVKLLLNPIYCLVAALVMLISSTAITRKHDNL